MPKIEAPKRPSAIRSTGRFMDFVPKSSPSKRPLSKARPTTFPSPKPTPTTPKNTTPIYEPTTITPNTLPTNRPINSSPISTPKNTKTFFRTTTAIKKRPLALKRRLEPTSVKKTVISEEIKFDVTPEPVPSAHPKKIETPKSPFIASVNVPKRPLSSTPIPSNYHASKNIYQRTPKSPALEIAPTSIVAPASRKSKLPMIILIIITIILGAAIGAIIYLCFFAN